MQNESAMRLFMRAVLILFPGFSDHMPCDYERALREELLPYGASFSTVVDV
jgi:hypothetical protein